MLGLFFCMATTAQVDHRVESKPWPFKGPASGGGSSGDATLESLEGVEIWHGIRDGDVPVKCAQHTATLVPKATLHVFEPCGHELAVGLIGNRLDALAAGVLHLHSYHIAHDRSLIVTMKNGLTHG